jgi:hypothetical protein
MPIQFYLRRKSVFGNEIGGHSLHQYLMNSKPPEPGRFRASHTTSGTPGVFPVNGTWSCNP